MSGHNLVNQKAVTGLYQEFPEHLYNLEEKMNVIMLCNDEKALEWARQLFGNPPQQQSESGTVIWVVSEGGPKTTAIYSIEEKDMFFDGGNSKVATPNTERLTVSLFEAKDIDPKRGEVAEWGKSAKEWNKASRRRLTPQLLQQADIFLAVNRNSQPQYRDLVSIKSQMVSLSKVSLQKGAEERGGYIAYNSLPQDRVIYPGSQTPEGPKYVWYGTSGATNIAELLLTMAAGYKLRLPVRFDNYGQSGEETGQGQKSMRLFASALQKINGLRIKLDLLSTEEDILNKVNISVSSLAKQIEWTLTHDVGLCYHSAYGQIRTNDYEWLDRNGYKSITRLHSEGYRFSGATIYWAFYGQAATKSFAAILYDGSKGGVHKLAKKWMTSPLGLWICPAGSFSIKPKNAGSEYEVIDPHTFLQSLQRSNQTEQVMNRLWEIALERVPLEPMKVGSKVIVEVNDDGSIAVK